MILVDTSAWTEFLRLAGDIEIKGAVKDLVTEGSAAFTCPVMFELALADH